MQKYRVKRNAIPKIRAFIAKEGMTIKDLADQVGTSSTVLHYLLNQGKHSAYLPDIARVMGIPLSELSEDEEPVDSPSTVSAKLEMLNGLSLACSLYMQKTGDPPPTEIIRCMHTLWKDTRRY